MTKDEALKLSMEAMEITGGFDVEILAIKEALAQPEPVNIAHKHEWFRTGEMKVGQMRCISCGTWGKEEITQRTWIGLTDEEILAVNMSTVTKLIDEPIVCDTDHNIVQLGKAIEAKLKEKNNA